MRGYGCVRGCALGALGLGVGFRGVSARAQAAPPAGHADDSFDVMNLMAARGLHDLDHERWNVYGQFTYISSWKLPFYAPYTNANGSVMSLSPDFERSFTMTLTLFMGLRLWHGGEVYMVPELIAERPLSNLRGIGGDIQNFELQKTGSESPQLYRARAFFRQTVDLGGDPVTHTSDPMQLGSTTTRRRLVFTVGNFTILDVFDRNGVTGDPRQTFLNMAFMTYTAWDFGSDARGYSWGATAEIFWDDWALRFGRMAPPLNPNVLPVDTRFLQYYSDAVEISHDHVLFGQPGAVRLLGYRNQENIGRFDDAIAAYEANPAHNAANCTGYNYGSTNVTAPDMCWVRRPNVKVGVGIDIEQHVTRDLGLFLRAMYSDGQSEVDAFNSADRSLSFGALSHGGLWHRPLDVTGLGVGLSWISDIHARYLAMGGVDGFVGDGHINPAAEGVAEAFYSVNFLRALWLTGDYQFLWNPGFNADRGPVHILGARIHAEF